MIYQGDTETQSKLLHEKLTEQVMDAAPPVRYKGGNLDCGYRIGLVVENSLILELKCLEHVVPLHEAQLLTYLKLTGKRVGLILNFNVSVLARGGTIRKIL